VDTTERVLKGRNGTAVKQRIQGPLHVLPPGVGLTAPERDL
jgi:hypothetical protein